MNISTVPGFIGTTHANEHRSIIALAGLVTVLFLGTYAGAQLHAGSKALHVLFGWNYSVGAILGAGIVLIYCYAGGIRASIWTDAAQSLIMLSAMGVMLWIAFSSVGGFRAVWNQLHLIDPSLTNFIPPNLKFGFPVYLLSWLAAGIGVVGQPHIVVRTMAIRSTQDLPTARRIYFLWYSAFTTASIGVGLVSRILIPQISQFDPELALPKLALDLLPSILVGLVLAGLFAATMSTADSQVLSCSAALTHDIYPQRERVYFKTKMGTLLVIVIALVIALTSTENVFTLVIISWSALASGLGPLVLLRSLGAQIQPARGITMMLAGISTVLVWHFIFQWSGSVYEVLPGMTVSFLVYFISSLNPKKAKDFS